jgi:FtsP/CotA-like multicopper oxidase with cupredoxin domain
MTQETTAKGAMARRTILRLGALGGAGLAFGAVQGVVKPSLKSQAWFSPDGAFAATSDALAAVLYLELFPTSPLILNPFSDPLPVPKALKPVPKNEFTTWAEPPGPGRGQQNSLRNQQHQIWPTQVGQGDPIVYKIDLKVNTHSFTTSQVLPIDGNGSPTQSFDGTDPNNVTVIPAGTTRSLPSSTIYGFNGTFPGPMINAEYGKAAIVRFENHLDENPLGLDRMDFGAPDHSFLTHLHNGHTAPESDGNPHYSMNFGPKHEGYRPFGPGNKRMWVDNLYLNWPAGGDDREKQSFFWFHDHRMDHTGANVYKGMVGLYPIYDPKNGLDMGDERRGLRLPGVRTNHSDGSFDVDYDIPLAFYDCRLDDGVTEHHDAHDAEYPAPGDQFSSLSASPNPRTHPEWWGKSFFRHMPNHGFVGDIFTVNGTAYPVLEVKRRKYRFRFLDASIARIYDFQLMTSTNGPKAAKDLGFTGTDLQGQWRIPDGQQCMQFTQIAGDGGLIPFAIKRDHFELWPAKRREVIIDFTKYMDGTPTTKGDEIYLTNTMTMPTGREWTNSIRDGNADPGHRTPILKFVIGDPAPDNSLTPGPLKQLRPLPPLPANWQSMMADRKIFRVERAPAHNPVDEFEWQINGEKFDPLNVVHSLRNDNGNTPQALQKKGSFALWEIQNGGGGWVHPFHLHMEEHRTVMRNGVDVTHGDPNHPEDVGREDLAALDPGEHVVLYRGFRDFVGPYVAHCHNLAHEDHAMMFGWSITS